MTWFQQSCNKYLRFFIPHPTNYSFLGSILPHNPITWRFFAFSASLWQFHLPFHHFQVYFRGSSFVFIYLRQLVISSFLSFTLSTPFSAIFHFLPSLILAPKVTKSLFLINRYHHSPILRLIPDPMVILRQGAYRRGYPTFFQHFTPFLTNLTTPTSVFHANPCTSL